MLHVKLAATYSMSYIRRDIRAEPHHDRPTQKVRPSLIGLQEILSRHALQLHNKLLQNVLLKPRWCQRQPRTLMEHLFPKLASASQTRTNTPFMYLFMPLLLEMPEQTFPNISVAFYWNQSVRWNRSGHVHQSSGEHRLSGKTSTSEVFFGHFWSFIVFV